MVKKNLRTTCFYHNVAILLRFLGSILAQTSIRGPYFQTTRHFWTVSALVTNGNHRVFYHVWGTSTRKAWVIPTPKFDWSQLIYWNTLTYHCWILLMPTLYTCHRGPNSIYSALPGDGFISTVPELWKCVWGDPGRCISRSGASHAHIDPLR